MLTPGPWCALAPLFGNHFLPCISMPGVVPGGLQSVLVPPPVNQFHCNGGYIQPHIRTLSDLLRAYYVIQQAVDQRAPHPLSPGDPSDAECELAYIKALLAEVPVAWLQPALDVVQHPAAQPPWPPTVINSMSMAATEQCVESMLVARLGWRGLPGGKSVSVAKLTVKLATLLQLGPVRAERRARHRQFVHLALGTQSAPEVAAGLQQLSTCMRVVWKHIKWDNFFKEVFWRLVIDALPTAARMHQQHSNCLCGAPMPGQQHHFWDCCIAQAVVQCIVSELPAAWCSRTPRVCPVLQRHVWLMIPPSGPMQLHKKVWMVVCLAAINAMDCGRKRANELRREWHIQQSRSASHAATSQLPQDQRSITQFFQPVPLTPAQLQHRQDQQRLQQQQAQQQQDSMNRLLLQAKQQAIAKFWQLLADFVILNPCPSRGFTTIPHDHPFICLDVNAFVSLAPRHHLQS